MKSWEIVAMILDKAVSQMEAARNRGLRADELTVFHAKKLPTITIHDYMGRLQQFSCCSEACFVLAFIYIDRVLQKNPSFPLGSLCIHRLILACLMIAIKFNDDIYYDNAFYAKIGGISVNEMNILEISLLSLTQFDLYVKDQVFSDYSNELLSHTIEQEKPLSPQIMEDCGKGSVPQIGSSASIDTVPSYGELKET